MIPYCLISRDSVLAYLRCYPDGRIHYRIASPMLGAVDMRTIRRHIGDAVVQIKEAALQLSALLSQIPIHATVPPMRVGQSQGEYLSEVVEQMHQAGRRAGGGSVPRIVPVVYVHAVSVFARSRPPLVPPLSCVLRAAVFHDTS